MPSSFPSKILALLKNENISESICISFKGVGHSNRNHFVRDISIPLLVRYSWENYTIIFNQIAGSLTKY